MGFMGFEKSDGLQNLTESLLAARLLPPGVYLVSHNQVFPIDRVRKDRKRARFVWTQARAKGARRKIAITPRP
jgi:L-asparaginase